MMVSGYSNGVLFLLTICLVCIIPSSYSWSQEELDLFDLVEEVNENFYTLLQVSEDAPLSDIKRAYRKLSLQYHPDKNRDDPNASETFRKIGAVADVLKDEETRAMYDSVLEYGLPDWRQPVYYYRRVRKMSLIELTALLMVVIVIGQLLYGWAVYAEKQLVLYELRQRKEKKDRKAKGRKSGTTNSLQLEAELLYHEALAKAALPHYTKLFPYVLVKRSIHYTVVLWYLVWGLIQRLTKSSTLEVHETEVVENGQQQSNGNKHNNKRRRNEVNKSTEKEELHVDPVPLSEKNSPDKTDSDTIVLEESKEEAEERKAKLIEKERELEEELKQLEDDILEEENWNKKSKQSKRRAHSTKIKSPLADKSIEYQQVALDDEKDPPSIEDKPQWSQYQQTQLELALKKYGKDEENRWELIAEVVPDKTKDECIVRYRELVELVRKRKTQ